MLRRALTGLLSGRQDLNLRPLEDGVDYEGSPNATRKAAIASRVWVRLNGRASPATAGLVDTL
jgi:hypothetical protein